MHHHSIVGNPAKWYAYTQQIPSPKGRHSGAHLDTIIQTQKVALVDVIRRGLRHRSQHIVSRKPTQKKMPGRPAINRIFQYSASSDTSLRKAAHEGSYLFCTKYCRQLVYGARLDRHQPFLTKTSLLTAGIREQTERVSCTHSRYGINPLLQPQPQSACYNTYSAKNGKSK
jgi:hypothetical protein